MEGEEWWQNQRPWVSRRPDGTFNFDTKAQAAAPPAGSAEEGSAGSKRARLSPQREPEPDIELAPATPPPPARGPYDGPPTPDSLKMTPVPSQQQQESVDPLADNIWRDETALEAQEAVTRVERDLNRETEEFRALDLVIRRKMEAQSSYEDLVFLWGLHHRNFALAPRLAALTTKEELLASLSADDVRTQHYDPNSPTMTLERASRLRTESAEKVRLMTEQLNLHIDVLNVKWRIPRRLEPKGHVQWALDVIEEEVYDEAAHQKRIAEARAAWSQPELMRNLKKMIRTYDEQVGHMEALEAEWNTVQARRPVVDPNDPRAVDKEWSKQLYATFRAANTRMIQIVNEWKDTLRMLRGTDAEIEGIRYLIWRFYDAYFDLKTVGYSRYGTTLGEDMPPWREKDLQGEINALRTSVESYQNALDRVELELQQEVSLDELRNLYTGKGKGMQKNASEKRLRAKHREVLEEKRKDARMLLESAKKDLAEAEPELEEFLRKKALLAPAPAPAAPAPVIVPVAPAEAPASTPAERAADAFIAKYAGGQDEMVRRIQTLLKEASSSKSQKRTARIRAWLISNWYSNVQEDPTIDDILDHISFAGQRWEGWRAVFPNLPSRAPAVPEVRAPGVPSERQFIEWAPDSPEGATLSTAELQARYRAGIAALNRFAETRGVALADTITREWDASAVPHLTEDIYGNFVLFYGRYQNNPAETQGFLERIAAAVFDQSDKAARALTRVLRTVMTNQ